MWAECGHLITCSMDSGSNLHPSLQSCSSIVSFLFLFLTNRARCSSRRQIFSMVGSVREEPMDLQILGQGRSDGNPAAASLIGQLISQLGRGLRRESRYTAVRWAVT